MLIRWIKKLFGIYDIGYEYRIPINRIVITPEFARTKVGRRKWKWKEEYYKRTGKFESKIELTKDFVLVDGYTSYLLAKKYGVNSVVVTFVPFLDKD